MSEIMTRRTLLKASAAAVAAAPVVKASSAFGAPALIAQTGSQIEITYWGSFTDALGAAEKALVDRFNTEQQDVKVNYQYQGSYEETAQKLTAAIAAKQTPDVSLLSDVWWFKFYLNSTLAPLNSLLSSNQVDSTDYVDSLFNEGVRDGESYWIPFARSTPLFYYNKGIFAEAGLSKAPETWAEFVEAAPAMVTKDGDTITRSAFAHPSSGSYIAWLFQGVVWQHNGAYSDPEFNIQLNQGGAVTAGELYRNSVLDGWATTPADINADFLNGLTASTFASTGGLAGMTKNATFEFGTAFLPKAEAFGCSTGGAGLSVLASAPAERQEAGLKFVQWATSPEMTAWWSQNTGYMPVRKSAVESPEMTAFFEANPNFKVAVDQLPLTRAQDSARVFIPNGDQIIGKGLERITISGDDVQQVFDEVAATLTEEAKPVLEAIAAL
jgi:sn-glycerol 3-phosphate transport system substrate-binding protein